MRCQNCDVLEPGLVSEIDAGMYVEEQKRLLGNEVRPREGLKFDNGK